MKQKEGWRKDGLCMVPNVKGSTAKQLIIRLECRFYAFDGSDSSHDRTPAIHPTTGNPSNPCCAPVGHQDSPRAQQYGVMAWSHAWICCPIRKEKEHVQERDSPTGKIGATSNKCIATSNKCLTTRNKKLVETISY